MKSLLKLSALALLVAVGAFVFTTVKPNVAAAQDEESTEQQAPAEENNDQEEQAPATFNYTAQAGDSYTKIARKAVQTYGFENNVNLSQAQIVAAETFLTQAAGSPKLSVGESVTINKSDVDAAVKKAQGLNESQIAQWQKYVAGVNFNTDHVGQA